MKSPKKTRLSAKQKSRPNKVDPHPDFADVNWPRHFALAVFQLTPLAPDCVDEDYEAVLATAPLLDGIFGGWPEGLTREANLIDLAWHEREFTARRSFSWILRDDGATYIGCFYLFPHLGTRGCATAAMWLCDIPNRLAIAQALKMELDSWLADNLPRSIDVTWVTRPVME